MGPGQGKLYTRESEVNTCAVVNQLSVELAVAFLKKIFD